MKKIFSILMVMVMVFSLAACATNNGGNNGDTGNNGGSVVAPDIDDKGNGNAGDNSDVDTEGSKDAETEDEVDSGMSVNSIANNIVMRLAEENPDNFAANMPIEGEMLDAYYPGLTNIAINDMAAYMPMMSVVVCEVIIVEVANPEDINAVKEIFQSRITYQIGDDENPGGAFYPESIETWKTNSEIVVEGNYVMMIAWSEKDSAINVFREAVAE